MGVDGTPRGIPDQPNDGQTRRLSQRLMTGIHAAPTASCAARIPRMMNVGTPTISPGTTNESDIGRRAVARFGFLPKPHRVTLGHENRHSGLDLDRRSVRGDVAAATDSAKCPCPSVMEW
jgi:hypothetical protein